MLCGTDRRWETWGRRGATLSAAGVVVEQVTCLVMWAGKSCSERERGAETGSPSHLSFVSLKLRWMLSLNHRIPLVLLSKDSVILSEILHSLDGGKHFFIYAQWTVWGVFVWNKWMKWHKVSLAAGGMLLVVTHYIEIVKVVTRMLPKKAEE